MCVIILQVNILTLIIEKKAVMHALNSIPAFYSIHSHSIFNRAMMSNDIPFLFSSVAVFQNNQVSPNNNCLQLVNSTLQFVNRFDNNYSQHNKRYKNHASLPYHILIMYCHNNGLHLNTEQDVCSTSGDINTTHLCISHSNHVLSQ